MKVVTIGDIHGRSHWKEVIKNELDFDVLVFVGDYWDSFDIPFEVQMHNFNEIIKFKEGIELTSSNKQVVLLIGNHDWHYLSFIENTNTSGYQTKYAFKIKELMRENHHHFIMAYENGEYLFSHAGISEKFLNATYPDWTLDTLVQDVNDLFKHKPNAFGLIGPDPYGRNTRDTPIWIRPKSLMSANSDSEISRKYTQVFGHTALPNVQKFQRRDFVGYGVDTFNHRISYLKIVDDDPEIVDLSV